MRLEKKGLAFFLSYRRKNPFACIVKAGVAVLRLEQHKRKFKKHIQTMQQWPHNTATNDLAHDVLAVIDADNILTQFNFDEKKTPLSAQKNVNSVNSSSSFVLGLVWR